MKFSDFRSIFKGRKNDDLLSFNDFQFRDQFQLQEKNKSYFFFFKDFWQTILNQLMFQMGFLR